MATMTVTFGDGRKEEREVDYLERDERTRMTLPIPILKDGEMIIRTIDGSIIVLEV